MIHFLSLFASLLLSPLRAKRSLLLENLALRQQLNVLRRSVKRPRVTVVDRLFWSVLCSIWSEWSKCLNIVKPETGCLATEREMCSTGTTSSTMMMFETRCQCSSLAVRKKLHKQPKRAAGAQHERVNYVFADTHLETFWRPLLSRGSAPE